MRSFDRDPYEPLPTKRPRYFVVRGSGTFPLDMLRYDSAWAVSGIGEVADEERAVVCACVSARVLTTERWLSFGWEVTRKNIPPPTAILGPRERG
jgi:hypothetical protein